MLYCKTISTSCRLSDLVWINRMYNKTWAFTFNETSSPQLQHIHALRTWLLKIIDIDIEQQSIKLLLHFS